VTMTTTPGSREAMLYSKGWNPETGAYTGSYLDSGQHYTSDEEARIRRLIQTEGPQTQYTTKYTPPENAAEIQKQIDLLDQQIAAGGKEIPGTGLIGMIERGPGEFEESPSYQFALSEGLKGQQNALSAMGRNRSGAHLKSATDYAENMASTEYQNFLNRWYQSLTPYQSLAGLGQTSASQTASAAGNYGAQAGANQIYAGQAQAAGQINQANVLTGAIQGGTNQLLYLNALRNVPQTGTASAPNYNYGYGAGYSGYGQGGY